MTYLVLLIACFGLLACLLAYVSDLKSVLKLTILPTFLVAVAVGHNFFLEEIGKPAAVELPEKSNYVAHRITNEDTILVWLRTEDTDRLYVIPYTRASAKELEEAQSKSEEGLEQGVETDVSDNGDVSLVTGDALDLDSFNQTK